MCHIGERTTVHCGRRFGSSGPIFPRIFDVFGQFFMCTLLYIVRAYVQAAKLYHQSQIGVRSSRLVSHWQKDNCARRATIWIFRPYFFDIFEYEVRSAHAHRLI